ncbi:MAG: HAMP domain-containing histidine kinase [Candidatus Symbiothrix sp.]|jgi:signal transduction histidine kinase|nr:HAMP domain-containing histidine kinase [Candidatus Symbiothrix sp.]
MKHIQGKAFSYLFIIVAGLIALVSLWITTILVDDLKEEERKKIEIWAESISLLSTQTQTLDESTGDFNNYDQLLVKILQGNTTIPVILAGDANQAIEIVNLQTPQTVIDPNKPAEAEFVATKIAEWKKKHAPIIIHLDEKTTQYVYYDDSTVLKRLQWFPFIQLTVVFIFIVIAFVALMSSQKAERNKVWVGLSKETAHQLGTPISSLMAWVEYLKTKEIEQHLLDEMDKDVQRLKTIAERFSKIGSEPELQLMDVREPINHAVSYMQRRISSKVDISTDLPAKPQIVKMSEPLFAWVLENLIKNAVDAMDGQGKITIRSCSKGEKTIVEVSDTGKGIPKSKFKTVFQPGYTTKARGWGLGLSLVKRIIESYQNGKIYVAQSEINKGTTFRIEL